MAGGVLEKHITPIKPHRTVWIARPPVNPKTLIILRGELLFWGELGY
jgi:hypothetical protein